MEQILEVAGVNIMFTVLAVLGVIVTLFATGITNFINSKAKDNFASANKQDYDYKVNLARTLVDAAEQIFGALKGEEKFKHAYDSFIDMLQEKGVPITDKQAADFIESAVKEMKTIDKAIDHNLNLEYEEFNKENVVESNDTHPF